jgi:hypothetical protein
MSQKDLMRAVIANLCFCESSSVPEPPYDTIKKFLANLDPIDNDILKRIFETSLESICHLYFDMGHVISELSALLLKLQAGIRLKAMRWLRFFSEQLARRNQLP